MTYTEHKHSDEEEYDEGSVAIEIRYSVVYKEKRKDRFSGVHQFFTWQEAFEKYNELSDSKKYEFLVLYENQQHNIVKLSNIS